MMVRDINSWVCWDMGPAPLRQNLSLPPVACLTLLKTIVSRRLEPGRPLRERNRLV